MKSTSAPKHPCRIHRHLQQPGFGLKLWPARCAGCINVAESQQKGFLSQILALLPVIGQAINDMENEFPILLDQLFNCLDSICLHLKPPVAGCYVYKDAKKHAYVT